jgi:hypothetical protein
MEGKIEEDAEAIGNGKAQLRYIYSCLEGGAKTNVTTFFENQVKLRSPSPRGLLDRLELLYGERNRKEKAIQNLYTIRQKEDEAFISFYPRFEKEMANADAESWPEHTKISYLRNALSSRLKDRLVGSFGMNAATYAEFAQKCVDISNDMELLGQWTRKANRYGSRTTESTPIPTVITTPLQVPREDMMEWEPTPAIQTKIHATRVRRAPNLTGYPSTRPEDQQLIGKRAKWVSQEEMDARRQEGRCLRCSRTGCRVATCPLAAAVRPSRIANIGVAPNRTVTTAAVQEDDEEPDTDQ